MSHLGQYLESLYSAEEDWPVVDATIHHWRDQALRETAESRRLVLGRKRRNAAPEPGVIEATIRAWLHLPIGLRVETESVIDEKSAKQVLVFSGENWHYESRGKRIQGGGGLDKCHHLTDVQRHFDRSLLRNFWLGLRLKELDAVTVAGRAGVRFHATHRPKGQIWPHWLPSGADRYEMIGDIATGSLLSISAILDDRVYVRQEVTQLEYDTEPDPTAFVTNTDGAQAEVVDDAKRIEHFSSPSAAQVRAGFGLFVPVFLPKREFADRHILFHSPLGDEAPRVRLTYTWQEFDKRLWISEGADPDRDDADFEWEEVQLPGLELKVSDPGEEGLRVLSFTMARTHISIVTDFDLPTALKIAASFAPCSS